MFSIPVGARTEDAVMAGILLFCNLIAFCWFAYEHRSDFSAVMTSYRRLESNEQNLDSSRLIPESNNEFVAAISASSDFESTDSEFAIDFDWKIVCTKTTLTAFVSKLPRLFYYSYYWSLLTVVLIYMYQLSCQFRYSKSELRPSHLRVYPLVFPVVSYPLIEWIILPLLKVRKTFNKLCKSLFTFILPIFV